MIVPKCIVFKHRFQGTRAGLFPPIIKEIMKPMIFKKLQSLKNSDLTTHSWKNAKKTFQQHVYFLLSPPPSHLTDHKSNHPPLLHQPPILRTNNPPFQILAIRSTYLLTLSYHHLINPKALCLVSSLLQKRDSSLFFFLGPFGPSGSGEREFRGKEKVMRVVWMG